MFRKNNHRRKITKNVTRVEKPAPTKVLEEDDATSSSDSDEDSESNPYKNLIASLQSANGSKSSDSSDSDVTESEEEPEVKRMRSTAKVDEAESSSDSEEDSDQDVGHDEEGRKSEESDVLAEEEDEDIEEEEHETIAGDNRFDLLAFDESDEESGDVERKKETDYYKSHVESSIEKQIQELSNNKPKIYRSLVWTTLSTLRCACRTSDNECAKKPHPFLPTHPIPKSVDSEALQKVHHVRRVIAENFERLKRPNQSQGGDAGKLFTPLQRELFTLFNSYTDVFFSKQDVLKNAEHVRQAYCLHAANHILRARSKVLRNTSRLKQMTPQQQEQVDYRDQGLTRPKVLFLVPFRETALKVVNLLLELLKRGEKFQVGYKRRFRDEFGKKAQEDEDSEDDQALMAKKPEDHQSMFAGNTDEHFRIGIALLRNSVRLYAPFYSSDIIVASPLGLRTVIGAAGEAHHEHDFLSSVELLILDHSDVFLMQNWEHVLHVFEHLHLTPKDSHGVDFSRVRNWSLDGHSKYYRQTIAIASVPLPQISSLFSKHCFNYRGVVSAEGTLEKGCICSIAKQLPQVFHKLTAASVVDSIDVRFRFFVERIYTQYKDPGMGHTLIYIPQYFDFVRIRNYMRKQWKDGAGPIFGHINDYSSPTEAGKAKRRFFTGKCPILLYTERYHFYNRIRIRGIRNLVFYELPSYPHFYSELCNMVRDSSGSSVTSGSVLVMYSSFDVRKLSSVVGASRSRQLSTSPKNVHMFVTGATAAT